MNSSNPARRPGRVTHRPTTLDRRALLRTAGGLGMVATLPACVSTNPATGRTSFTGTYAPEDDIRLGREQHPKLVEAFGGEYQHPRLQGYVQSVGLQLAGHTEYQQFPYRFTLLNSPIVNAFALPGGYVYITRGLLALASNEAEMAGVLAHELGHVNARHTAERLSAQQATQFGLLLGAIGARLAGLPGQVVQLGRTIAALSIQSYSRQQEFEADTLGVRYMSRAGFEPDAMVTFLSTLREQSQVEARSMGLPAGSIDEYNMMSTHPRTVDRVREAQAAAEAQRPASPRLAREAYLQQVDGMLYGDDPSEGITIGSRFVHPGMGFEFTVPAGFRVRNQPDKVIAQDPSGAAMVFDIGPVARAHSMPDYVQAEWAQKRLNDVETLQVNGLTGGTGWTRGSSNGTPVDLRLVALARDARSAWRLLFITPTARTAELADAFRRTTYSFKQLTPEQARSVAPLRLQVRKARADDSIAQLARNLPYGALNEAWYRVLNDLPENQSPRPGQLIKVFST
ncbi:MAG: M48 family metalloprotease [Gammaproteobacteria bacterium]|nr:M48 family metalloprotease [Gammaproteobacteria bacterium]